MVVGVTGKVNYYIQKFFLRDIIAALFGYLAKIASAGRKKNML
jgi:hypothetical protein